MSDAEQTQKMLAAMRRAREAAGVKRTRLIHPDPLVQAARERVEALGAPAPFPPASVSQTTALAMVKSAERLARLR